MTYTELGSILEYGSQPKLYRSDSYYIILSVHISDISYTEIT